MHAQNGGGTKTKTQGRTKTKEGERKRQTGAEKKVLEGSR
jgi:hypothetical protein